MEGCKYGGRRWLGNFFLRRRGGRDEEIATFLLTPAGDWPMVGTPVFVPIGSSAKQDDLPPSCAASKGMNKSGLIDFVHRGMEDRATRVAAGRAVSLVLEGIQCGLQRDKTVQLVGFGTFKVVERKARATVHPKTRQPLTILRSRTVKLVVGKELKNRI